MKSLYSYKSKKTFVDYGMSMIGLLKINKDPKYEVYKIHTLFFGIIKWYEYTMTYTYDPKKFLNVVESNY